MISAVTALWAFLIILAAAVVAFAVLFSAEQRDWLSRLLVALDNRRSERQADGLAREARQELAERKRSGGGG